MADFLNEIGHLFWLFSDRILLSAKSSIIPVGYQFEFRTGQNA